MRPWFVRIFDPAPSPNLDKPRPSAGALVDSVARLDAQDRMARNSPPVVPDQSPYADAAAWRIHAEGLEQALNDECRAHADTIKLVERLGTTPTPEDLWMEVRASDEAQKARRFQRMYGKASATIGALRDQLARVRTQREDAESVVVAVAVALGCGPQPSEQWLLDTAVRAGKLLAEDGETFRRKLLAAAEAVDRATAWTSDGADDDRRACAKCTDRVHTLSARDWCDSCEIDAAVVAQEDDAYREVERDAALVERARVLGDEIGQRDPNAITWTEIEELAMALFEAEVQIDHVPAAYAALDSSARATLRRQAQHLARSGWTRQVGSPAVGQRDRTAAIEGAAITLRAHILDPKGPRASCRCGWGAEVIRPDGPDKPGYYSGPDEYARHVAEQLAAVGALGSSAAATPPDLIDKDGDRWRWQAGYVHGNGPLGLRSRELLDASFGPVREVDPEEVPF